MTSANSTPNPAPNAELSGWLKLREAADAASRSADLTRIAAEATRSAAGDEAVRVLDLGTGAGSNLRYLIPRLPPRQRWLVVDRGEDLLADLLARTAPWAAARGLSARVAGGRLTISGGNVDCVVETRQMDLGPLADPSIFDGRNLVTASALLDLVSASWLATVAGHCRTQRAVALFTITYNGGSTCQPEEPEDALVLDLFNRHQRTDKGLGGPAAGPGATEAARRAFEAAGFTVRVEPSDWTIGPEAQAMQQFLVDGWASAASEVSSDDAPAIADWRRRRLAHIKAGLSRLSVGHHDLLATP
ncbi:MAG: class I SAM-dependent methyltransferase [Vicinamibacterales bacterium]